MNKMISLIILALALLSRRIAVLEAFQIPISALALKSYSIQGILRHRLHALRMISTPSLSPEEKSRVGLGKTAIIAGASGYIGKAVVAETVQRGYKTIALVRNKEKYYGNETAVNQHLQKLDPLYASYFTGAILEECDVENPAELEAIFNKYSKRLEVVCSCLASATGIKGEPERIDNQATLNLLNACKNVGGRHFILLSAFCVAKPLLELQRQKLRLEAELAAQSDVTYSIVRPTAYFKSVSGQLEGIQRGAPYVLFGKGNVTRCNPISKEDLAYYMMDSATNEQKWNKIMNIGGPDVPLTNQMLAEMMFASLGLKPKFVYVPTWIFDASISLIQFISNLSDDNKWNDVLETARIGKYYAVEDMLTTKEDEKFGKIKMKQHFDSIAKDGQDPFTPVRATAIIGRIFEAVPVVIGVTILLGLGKLTVVFTSAS